MKKKRNIIKTLLVFLLLIISACLILYPFIANYIFENRVDSVIETVEKNAEDITESRRKAELQAAEEYNRIIANGHVTLTDPFVAEGYDYDLNNYDSLLNMTDDGIMGVVEIPSINVSLPIYHGTSEEVLEEGAGHLQGTSLPIGGESTHSVLTGHTGLSHAKLFTDLTELEEGDIFFVEVMGEKLAYKVDQIKVVLPTELDDLAVIPGGDYCTLLTCTPYGVNTYRLLVRGVRTDYQEAVDDAATYKEKQTESKWMSEYKKALIISLGFFTVGLLLLFGYRRMKEHRR